MSSAPVYHIDPVDFFKDPYPDLANMRRIAPVAFVPELGATLFTKRDDIFLQEKRIDVFSSSQPDGLMTILMGENVMRKDGEAHQEGRRAIFPAMSPRTVRDHWMAMFIAATDRILTDLAPRGSCDLVRDFAMPVAAEALKVITGLSNMQAAEMDRVSQGMIDGISNYAGLKSVEENCNACTALIDQHIDAMLPMLQATPNSSLISVQLQAGLSMQDMRANIKLAISGGQNEPRDAIAGTAWALLTHPDQLAQINAGAATWQQAFEEYARWISPIGMSPRRIGKPDTSCGVDFDVDERVFFMFGAANRDEDHFSNADAYDLTRSTRAALSFGAGPHFCAGAAAARALIADVALPKLFASLTGLHLTGDAPFEGWAFRGPTAMPVAWSVPKRVNQPLQRPEIGSI